MTQRYTRTAIFLHWLVALGLIGTFALGFYMEGLALSPDKLKLYAWHKWAGMTLLVLIVVRLAWRLSHPAPELPISMKPMERLQYCRQRYPDQLPFCGQLIARRRLRMKACAGKPAHDRKDINIQAAPLHTFGFLVI